MEDSISFEWNEEKNEINKRKHNVSFEEAVTVFYDTEARVVLMKNIHMTRIDSLFWDRAGH